jgi:hypothetical protein
MQSSNVLTQLQIGEKPKGRKAVQLDKPKPVTQLSSSHAKDKHHEKQDIFTKQEATTNLQDLVQAKLQELSQFEAP